MGDLSDISSKEELSSRYDKFFDKNPRGKGQDVGQVWRFLNDMQIGDYVILQKTPYFILEESSRIIVMMILCIRNRVRIIRISGL